MARSAQCSEFDMLYVCDGWLWLWLWFLLYNIWSHDSSPPATDVFIWEKEKNSKQKRQLQRMRHIKAACNASSWKLFFPMWFLLNFFYFLHFLLINAAGVGVTMCLLYLRCLGCFFIFIFIFYLFIFWRRLVRIMNNLAEMHFCTSMTLEITTTDSPQQQAQTSTSIVNPIIDFAQTQLIIYARMHEHISRKVHTVHTLFRRGVTCLHPRW